MDWRANAGCHTGGRRYKTAGLGRNEKSTARTHLPPQKKKKMPVNIHKKLCPRAASCKLDSKDYMREKRGMLGVVYGDRSCFPELVAYWHFIQ